MDLADSMAGVCISFPKEGMERDLYDVRISYIFPYSLRKESSKNGGPYG